MTPERPAQTNVSPIADLSYRNYDGPLYTRAARWWIVALANIRLVVRKPGFWILAAMALLPYLIIAFILYFQAGTPQNIPNPLTGNAPDHKYAIWFYRAIAWEWLFFFSITLIVGAGSIAADNKSNALVVYLSKPITKGDYLFGKWMGIFIILFAVAIVPSMLLYLYCLTSYLSDGFLKQEPWLVFHVGLAAVVPAAIHSSLMVGFSAWSKSPRMAGAVYAAFYFLLAAIFEKILAAILLFNGLRERDFSRSIIVGHLSVDGVIQGLAQNIFGVTERIPGPRFQQVELSAPPLWLMLSLAAVMVVGGLAAARSKIRAVEVVRG